MDVAACARPRYVDSRKENWICWFWTMVTTVPVVLSPSARRKKAKR
jgi:hypothetical protein